MPENDRLFIPQINYTTFWILAAPKEEAYEQISRPEAIAKYRKMAYEDFDKQFKSEEDQIIGERAMYAPDVSLNVMKRIFISAEIYEWNNNPAELKMWSLIYTSFDGYPFAEAVFAKEFNAGIRKINDVERDLLKFYWDHNWKTKIDVLKDVEPDKEEARKLDDIVLPTIAQVFKYNRR